MTLQEEINKISWFNLPNALKSIFNKLTSQGSNYKVYSGLFTQLGTNAPQVTIMENTIGDIVWSRDETGSYLGTLAGAFTENKVFSPQEQTVNNEDDANIQYQLYVRRLSNDAIAIGVRDNDDSTTVDGVLLEKPIEIRVYN